MGQAHEETVELVVKAGSDFGISVMGDNLGMPDMVTGAKKLADLGCHQIIHHIGYDFRNLRRERGQSAPDPLVQLRDVVAAVDIPVQAVGGLTLQQAIETPSYGAPLVVIGAPLAIDADSFKAASGDTLGVLKEICDRVHGYGNVPVGKEGLQ